MIGYRKIHIGKWFKNNNEANYVMKSNVNTEVQNSGFICTLDDDQWVNSLMVST